MWAQFDDQVFRLGQRRERRRRQERLEQAGVDPRAEERLRAALAQLPDDSPEKDRIASFDMELSWLRQSGFRSVDHIWHFWMEHFVIARR
jgi:hypothetical protein